MELNDQLKTIDRRSADGTISKQPRYTEQSFGWSDFLRWTEEEVPTYQADSRERDKWQIEFLKREPHVMAIIGQVASLIANRGWELVGGRNTVNLVRNILHDANRDVGARFGRGYRNLQRRGAFSYYAANLGAPFELGRNGKTTARLTPPLSAIWNVDPTKCSLTKNPQTPLKYYPGSISAQDWMHSDFFLVTANPSVEDRFGDLGYAAVAIILELAQILIAVYKHDREQLDNAAPQGLLLLKNISKTQWDGAMKERRQKMEAKELRYFGGTMVIPTVRADQPPEANLLALSQLPANFSRQETITMLIYLIAAAVEFPPEEFWPVQTGAALGRSVETQTQMERATDKGDASYFLIFQERFQRELPSSGSNEPIVLFEFEERSDKGRQIAAEVAKTYADIAATLYESGLSTGDPLISKAQALQFLVDNGVLDPSITDTVEETQADDTQVVRARIKARSNLGIWNQARWLPQEPIVHYEWPSRKETVLWESGFEMTKPAMWRGIENPTSLQLLPRVQTRQLISRQDVLYEDEDVLITEDDREEAIDTAVPAIVPFLEAELVE